MGLTPDVFWSMTPREFNVWHDQNIERISHDSEMNDRRLAVLLAHTANLWGDGKKTYSINDFLESKEEKKPMEFNVMAEMLKVFTVANNGTLEG
jgi:hypothetical protein